MKLLLERSQRQNGPEIWVMWQKLSPVSVFSY